MNREKIKENFSRAAVYYDRNTNIQKQAAQRLASALEPWRYSVPEGPVLEIGAGTGFFTQFLLEMFKGREIIISDFSQKMVEFCRDKIGNPESVQFQILDAEKNDWQESVYGLIAGNFVAQWFKHPGKALSEMTAALKPGGLLLASFPANESFQNWKEYCRELGLPFTANSLPDVEQVVIELSMGPVKVDFYEDDMFETYDSVLSFFRHLKRTGTSTNLSGSKLSVKQLRLLNDYWLEQDGGKVEVQYHTAFIAVKKDLET